MDIEFLDNVKLSMYMKGYIYESIDFSEEELSATVSSLVRRVLQNIDDSYTRLENKYAYILHYIVEKLIWE